jgi:hypothetical protein
MQGTIDGLIGKDCTANLIVAFTLNKLWRMINSLQVVLILPLMNIKFQPNAELVYNFLDSNSNMYFGCENDQNEIKSQSVQKQAEKGFFTYSESEPFSE